MAFVSNLWQSLLVLALEIDFVFDLQLRATLDEGPRSRDQWIQAILLVQSCKLVPRMRIQDQKVANWG
jgi:hypothetical protein